MNSLHTFSYPVIERNLVRMRQVFCSNKDIFWGFNLAKAPWQTGCWKRLVSLCKRCFKKVVGKNKLTFDELQVIISKIESTLSNRPL